MKRMSILVLIACMTIQQIGLARSYTRVRYSMRAFSYKNPSGLIPGYVRYSPYAFGFDHPSGLVNEWTSYNMYAFGINHNGLISEYGAGLPYWNDPIYSPDQNRLTQAIDRLAKSIDCISSNQYVTHSPGYSRAYTKKTYTVRADDLNSDNPRIFMKAYLDTQIPGEFKVSNLLRIDQEVVSFNVVVKNRNLVIKYWNLPKIRSIKNASNEKTEQLSKYMEKWAAVENFYDEHGEQVVHIMSPERSKIIQELAHCLKTETM